MEFNVLPKVQEIADLTDLNQRQIVQLYLCYFIELQKGRVKPDRTGAHGIVYDSLDNLPEIEAVKRKLAELLNLDLEIISQNKSSLDSSKRENSYKDNRDSYKGTFR